MYKYLEQYLYLQKKNFSRFNPCQDLDHFVEAMLFPWLHYRFRHSHRGACTPILQGYRNWEPMRKCGLLEVGSPVRPNAVVNNRTKWTFIKIVSTSTVHCTVGRINGTCSSRVLHASCTHESKPSIIVHSAALWLCDADGMAYRHSWCHLHCRMFRSLSPECSHACANVVGTKLWKRNRIIEPHHSSAEYSLASWQPVAGLATDRLSSCLRGRWHRPLATRLRPIQCTTSTYNQSGSQIAKDRSQSQINRATIRGGRGQSHDENQFF